MEEIGLFPLGLVLLPRERVPLHIFEDRYKELIGECLDGDRPFGIVLDKKEGVTPVGTTAHVVEVLERFPDGRLNIVVEGQQRFRIRRVTQGRSFATAEVEAFEDEGGAPDEERIQRCRAAYDRLVEVAGEVEEGQTPSDDLADGELSFAIAARIDFGVEVRQALIQERSEDARLTQLEDLLERAAEVMRVQKLAQERARGNGEVEQL